MHYQFIIHLVYRCTIAQPIAFSVSIQTQKFRVSDPVNHTNIFYLFQKMLSNLVTHLHVEQMQYVVKEMVLGRAHVLKDIKEIHTKVAAQNVFSVLIVLLTKPA